MAQFCAEWHKDIKQGYVGSFRATLLASQFSVSVTFPSPLPSTDGAVVLVQAEDYFTKSWVTNLTTTGCDCNFSAAPGGNTTIHVHVFRARNEL